MSKKWPKRYKITLEHLLNLNPLPKLGHLGNFREQIKISKTTGAVVSAP